MSEHSLVWLREEALALKYVINIACGASVYDWPPQGQWRARFKTLKLTIDRGELSAVTHGAPANRFTHVRLADLWTFATTRAGDHSWDWLRDFCQSWATVRGDVLPTLDTAASSELGEDMDAAATVGPEAPTAFPDNAGSEGPQPKAHAETAKLRSKLKAWLKKKACADEARQFTKADFLDKAREEVDSRISITMFREVWRGIGKSKCR